MNNYKSRQFQLRLMATTDLHVSLTGYDYYQDRETEIMGLSRTASLIDQARKEVSNHLLFDNGDILQGNPLGDYAASNRYWQRHSNGIHPLIEMMNTLNYDAATLGNHEFNYGLDYLQQCLSGAQFPYINANVYKLEEDQSIVHLLTHYDILNRTLTNEEGNVAEIRIGVIGVVPPQIMNWDRGHLEGKVTAHDMVDAVKEMIPQLREEGADIIVLLAHCGYVPEGSLDITENAAGPLSRLSGVDAMFFGHAHKVFPGEQFHGQPELDLERGTMNGIPAAEPGVWGSHLGIIDLQLDYDGNQWKCAVGLGQVRPIFDHVHNKALVEPDRQLEQMAQLAHNETIQHIRTPVGEIQQPLYSYFALVMDTPVVQLINDAQLSYARTLLAQTSYANYPLLSAASPFKTGGRYGASHYTDIAAGPLTLQHMSDLYSYANTLCAVRLTGGEVREWLEWSAGLYYQIDPQSQAEQELIDPSFSTFNFDVIDGLNYCIDISVPARYDASGILIQPDCYRIQHLTYQGKPILEEMEFVVVTNQYRAYSTVLANPDGQRIVLDSEMENRDVLTHYIRKQGILTAAVDYNWTLRVGSESTSTLVTFLSSPAARHWVDAFPMLTWLGNGPHGFDRYGLQL